MLRASVFSWFGSLLAGYAVCAALLAIVVATAQGAPFSTGTVLGGGALSVWLAANHVPLDLDGGQLGVLPLALTLLLGWFLLRAAKSVVRRHDVGTPAQGALVCTVFGMCQAIVGAVIAGSLGLAQPVPAFLICALIAGISALLGLAGPTGMVSAALDRLGPVGVSGVRLGLAGAGMLLAAGAVSYTVASIATVPTGSELFASSAPGVGSAFGMLLLCVGYLPNAALAGASFVSGPGFSIGDFSLTPMSFQGGSVPGMPLLAALPEQFAMWWPAFLLLPLAAAMLLGWLGRNRDESPVQRLRIYAVAGLVAAVAALVFAALAGGSLGARQVVVPAGAFALTAFGWIGVVGGVTAWFAGPGTMTSLPPEDSVEEAMETEEPVAEHAEEDLAETESEAELEAESDAEDDAEDNAEDNAESDAETGAEAESEEPTEAGEQRAEH